MHHRIFGLPVLDRTCAFAIGQCHRNVPFPTALPQRSQATEVATTWPLANTPAAHWRLRELTGTTRVVLPATATSSAFRPPSRHPGLVNVILLKPRWRRSLVYGDAKQAPDDPTPKLSTTFLVLKKILVVFFSARCAGLVPVQWPSPTSMYDHVTSGSVVTWRSSRGGTMARVFEGILVQYSSDVPILTLVRIWSTRSLEATGIDEWAHLRGSRCRT